MVDLLDQTLSQGGVDELAPTTAVLPPKEMPDIERFVRPRWPRSAKIVTAVLAVLAVAGVFGTGWQYFNDDAADYQAQVSDLTDQRNALLAQNGNLRTDADALEADQAQVTADNALLTADKAQLTADNAELTADNAQLQAESAAVSAELTAAQAQNSTLSTELAVATAQVNGVNNQVYDLQATNETVTAERDALAAMFPMVVGTSLEGVDITGTYGVKWFPAYNSGLANISLPNVSQVVISKTPEGWIQVGIPGVVTAGLFPSDGALSTMVDTTTAVPPANGVARIARVTLTIHTGETATAEDGTTTVTGLGMSIGISTPAVEDAPAGVALYGAELTPQA